MATFEVAGERRTRFPTGRRFRVPSAVASRSQTLTATTRSDDSCGVRRGPPTDGCRETVGSSTNDAPAQFAAVDIAPGDFDTYQYPQLPVFPAEERILSDVLRPGMRVLDLGCGDGRITQTLAGRAVGVLAFDLSFAALVQVRAKSLAERLIGLGQADARSLPFGSASIDVVIFAFNGIDALYPEEERVTALREIGRVLRPGGYFILSTQNPLGTLLSPRGMRSRAAWRWRAEYALSGAMRQPYFRNQAGLRLYHAQPRRVVAQVSEHSNTTFLYCLNRSGISHSVAIVTLFSAWPYYVFRRTDRDACR